MADPRISLELKGVIPSKKNLYRRGAQRGMFIDKALKTELDGFTYELIRQRNKNRLLKPLNGDLRVEAVFYVPNLKSDLDNAYTALQDLLQNARIIQNDRQISEFIVRRDLDKKNPRVETHIYENEE